MRDKIEQIERERNYRATRVERLRALAGRTEGLSDERVWDLEYNDGVRFGLDLALMIIQGTYGPSTGAQC